LDVQPALLLSCHIDATARAIRSGENQYAFSAGAKKGMNNAKRPTELKNIKSASEEQEAYMLPAFKMFIEK